MWDSLLLTLQSDTDTSKYSLHLLSLFLNFLLPLQKASKQKQNQAFKKPQKNPQNKQKQKPHPKLDYLGQGT